MKASGPGSRSPKPHATPVSARKSRSRQHLAVLSRARWNPHEYWHSPSGFRLAIPMKLRSPTPSALRFPRRKLRAHFHNTRNTGLANAYAAIEAGVRSLDASCGGIGGCPFAPAATGNVPTEDLIYMLHRMGFDTGVDLPALLETTRWLQQTLDH